VDLFFYVIWNFGLLDCYPISAYLSKSWFIVLATKTTLGGCFASKHLKEKLRVFYCLI